MLEVIENDLLGNNCGSKCVQITNILIDRYTSTAKTKINDQKGRTWSERTWEQGRPSYCAIFLLASGLRTPKPIQGKRFRNWPVMWNNRKIQHNGVKSILKFYKQNSLISLWQLSDQEVSDRCFTWSKIQPIFSRSHAIFIKDLEINQYLL